MFTKKSLFSFVIFSFFINLFFIGAANAEPLTMTGSNQMSVNQSQTFTAAGGYGGYTWSLEGNGTLSGTDDPSVTYTAPATNPNCTTTKICVADFRNKKYCKYIAINAYFSTSTVAYKYKSCKSDAMCIVNKFNAYFEPCAVVLKNYVNCQGTLLERTWCGGGNTDGYEYCPTGFCATIGRDTCANAAVAYESYMDCNYRGEWPEGLDVIVDVRTPAMIAAGCCPAAILPPDEVPDDEPYVECIDGEKTTCTETGPDGTVYTGTKTCVGGAWGDCIPNKEDETGNNCSVGSVKSNSKVNVKSGNLYHDQDVGVLGFSYNGIDNNDGPLGKKWTHNYNQQITLHSDNNTLLFDADDGNAFLFTLSGGIYYPRESSSEKSQIIKNADGTFTRTLKNGTIETYNSSGKLTFITERNGKTTTLTYSGNDLISITDAADRTTNITNSEGKITAITNPAGQTYTLSYTDGLLASITDPANNSWQFTYDSNGHMLTKKDPSDNTVTYTYDDHGRILTSTDPEGLVRAMSYGADNITTFTEKDGGVWTYKYDPILVAIIEKTNPLGNTTTYTYDEKRHLIATTYPDGTTTTNTYDENGNLTSSTDALGHTTTYTYNEQNLVTSITDAAGKQTQYSYDANGNMTSITDPAGAKTQYAYDTKGNITSITNALGKTTTMFYDQYNNLISVTDPTGAKITMTYDNLGNMTSQTDAAGNITTFQYNNLNQMIAVIDSTGKVTNYTYDAQGNVLTTTDANGNKTTNAYNYKSQLIQTVDALGNVTRFTYGATSCGSGCGGTDKLTAVTDAKNQTTTYEYDQAGRLIRETDPLGRVTSYQYDAKGNMLTKTKPDGRTINYIHDEAGRLLERRYPNNTSDIFQYDQTGNLIMATTNQNIAYYYAYDAAGRLTGVTDSNLRNIEYLYDATGNRISMTIQDGTQGASAPRAISYEYNANNQLTKITANGSNFTFAYDNLNRRIKRTLPNGTYTTYSYDQNSRLTNITHKNNHNKIIDAFSYTHDNVGNRLTKTEEGIMPHAPDKTINYTYDAIYRLQAAEPEKRGKGKLSEAINKYHTENYTYDAVGNRQSGPLSRDSYSYNTGNELITSTGRIILERDNQYEYDLNGNLIKKTQTIKNKWKLITTYAYDDENRLIEVKIQKGHKIKEVSFTYDPLGRRISKTVGRADFEDEDEEELDDDDKDKGNHGGAPPAGGEDASSKRDIPQRRDKPFQPQTTYYVYDDQNIIAEYDENNKLIASYVHGPNIDEPLSAEIRRDWVYYHADGLGSITTLTSHMGNVLQKYDYDSFGNMRPAPRWIKQPFTYTGREFDQETGLYYYRARYYDAKVGRFITKDPIGFDGGDVNLYVYVGNNPINWIDPFGLFTYWESRPGATGKLAGEALAAANCMEKCMGKSFIVSGGSEKTGHAKNSKHYTNQAFDMYHGGHDRKKTFCCALKCNIKYIKDESATANHWHFQTVPGLNGSRGALPTTEECCER